MSVAYTLRADGPVDGGEARVPGNPRRDRLSRQVTGKEERDRRAERRAGQDVDGSLGQPEDRAGRQRHHRAGDERDRRHDVAGDEHRRAPEPEPGAR